MLTFITATTGTQPQSCCYTREVSTYSPTMHLHFLAKSITDPGSLVKINGRNSIRKGSKVEALRTPSALRLACSVCVAQFVTYFLQTNTHEILHSHTHTHLHTHSHYLLPVDQRNLNVVIWPNMVICMLITLSWLRPFKKEKKEMTTRKKLKLMERRSKHNGHTACVPLPLRNCTSIIVGRNAKMSLGKVSVMFSNLICVVDWLCRNKKI